MGSLQIISPSSVGSVPLLLLNVAKRTQRLREVPHIVRELVTDDLSICGFIIIRRPQLNRSVPCVQNFIRIILTTWWWVKTSSGGLFFLSFPPPSSRLSGKEGLENPSEDSMHNMPEDHDEKNNSNINHCKQPSLLQVKVWWLEVMFCKYVCTHQ